MESPAPFSRYVNRNSKKRMFPGDGSSSLSATCKNEEALEISPPSNLCPAKPRSSKNKEVVYQEIIDLDAEGESDSIKLTGVLPYTSGKGKELLQYSSVGLNNSVKADNFGFSELEDAWPGSYQDNMIYDDCSILEPPFNPTGIPTGVEVPLPWFLGPSKNKAKVKETNSSRAEPMPDAAGNSPLVGHMYEENPTKLRRSKRSAVKINTDHIDKKVRMSSKHMEDNGVYKNGSASGTSLSLQSSQAPWAHMSTNPGLFLTLDLPGASGEGSMLMPMSPFPMFEPAFSPQGFPNDGAFRSAADHIQNCASSPGTSIPTSAEAENVDEISQKYASFKKFEVVQDFSDHHYRANGSAKQPPKNWAKKIQDEWRILEKDLPDTIFVRVYESRIDLLRAVILGAEGTPYHDGLYFFDVFFPSSYPNVPPHVYYHSGGLRINPNLYNCGKVCLSLLNTWSGGQQEKWIPGTSTMLQVLVSIQGLILNAKPYFNEPGYASSYGSVQGEKRSLDYNESTFMLSLQTMVYNMRRPPKHFEDFTVGHFRIYARDILISCKAYLDGAQVGCLVKGGVQDVDEGDKSCSDNFKSKLSGYISVLVNAFLQVGAKDCEEFLSLAPNESAQAPPAPPRRKRGARKSTK